jgi:hypothetical protein
MVITVSKQIQVNKLLKRVTRKLIARITNLVHIRFDNHCLKFQIKNKDGLVNVFLLYNSVIKGFECFASTLDQPVKISISDLLNQEFLHSCDCKGIVKRTIKILAVELQKEVQ